MNTNLNVHSIGGRSVDLPVATCVTSLQQLTGFQAERFDAPGGQMLNVGVKNFISSSQDSDYFVFHTSEHVTSPYEDGTPLLIRTSKSDDMLFDDTSYLIGMMGVVTIADVRDGIMYFSTGDGDMALNPELYNVLGMIVGDIH